MSMVYHHEMIERFAESGLPLGPELEAMLGEDPAHRTERRGSGFTQATRYLADRINRPRSLTTLEDLTLFREWKGCLENQRILGSLAEGRLRTWRYWHQSPPDIEVPGHGPFPTVEDISEEAARQARLSELVVVMEREESRLLTSMIRDLILPVFPESGETPSLPAWPVKLEVGSCPLAEKWFLELAHGFIPRKGRCNFLVDARGIPMLLEKTGMGDDHSCLSLQPLIMNGVRIPAGSLLAVKYDSGALDGAPWNQSFPGQFISIGDCQGFRMLRLTTLAVSGVNRARAFSSHFDSQVAEGLFEPENTDIKHLRRLAERSMNQANAS